MKRKLAAFGLAFALAQLAAAYLPPLTIWPAAVFVLAAAGTAVSWLCKRHQICLLLAAVCLGVGCHMVYHALAVRPVQRLAGRQVEVLATVEPDAQTSYQEDRLRGTLHITRLNGSPADFKVNCTNFPGTRPGEIFSATLQLQLLEADSYRMGYYADGVFLSAEYLSGYEYQGESGALRFWLSRLRQELSRRIMTFLPSEEGGVEVAMLVGDTTRLSDTQKENFRAAGVSHLLAVSGLHVTLLCGLLGASAGDHRRFSRRRILGQSVLLLFYLALIGFPVSAVRAAVIYLITLGGYFFLQPPDLLTSMGVAAVLMGLGNAYFPCDLGFQLSFSAVLGVQAAASLGRWQDRILPDPEDKPALHLARRFLLRLAGTVETALLAGLATMPVLLAHRLTVSGVGVLANLLVVWMLQPALLLGIGVLVVSAVPGLGFVMQGISLVLAVWLRVMCRIIAWCAGLPGARLSLPAGYTLFVLAVLGMLGLWFWKHRRMLWYLPAAALCAAAAIAMGLWMSRDVVHIGVVGTAGNPCLVVTQNSRAAVLFRGGSSNLRAVQDYLLNQGQPPVTVLVDLRQEPRTLSFDADRVLTMDSMDSKTASVALLDGITLELLHDSGGNLAVLDICGYTVGVMAGRVKLPQPLPLNLYCAGSSYPDILQADTIVCTSRAADWLSEAGGARVLYGPEDPVITIRPGSSALIQGVNPYALQ